MAALRDLVGDLSVAESIRPAVHSASVNGQSVDMRGFSSAMVAITTGAVAGSGNMTPKLQESDDNSAWTDVGAGDLSTAFPTALAANSVYRVGYRGPKRYLRAVGTLNSGTSVAFAAVVVLGAPAQRPVA